MKTDDAYSVDSILQRFMEKIPLKSFSEQYLRDHYICFSVVESIKADYSVAVITDGALIGVSPKGLLDRVQFYYDPNLDNAVFCNQCVGVEAIDLRYIRIVNVEKMML